MTDYSVFGARERDGWADADISGNYVTGFGPLVDAAAEVHVAALDRPSKVLDLCCGQGTLTARLVEAGHEVTGLDFSTAMLERARAAAPDAALVDGDAQDLPFADASFDAVVCNFGVMHVPDQPKALAEVHRVLRPDGLYSMTGWAGPVRPGGFQLIVQTARAFLPDGVTPPPAPDYFLYARKPEATAFLAASGLKITTHRLIDLHWDLDRPDALFDAFLTGTVGMRMLLLTLDEAQRDAMRADLGATIARDFSDGEGFRVPESVAHIVARPI